jgi:hypothetical protein
LHFTQDADIIAIPLNGTEAPVQSVTVQSTANNRVRIDASVQLHLVQSITIPSIDYRLRLYRDDSLITEYRIQKSFIGTATGSQRFLETAMFADVPPAGSNTYRIGIAVLASSGIASFAAETRTISAATFLEGETES